MAIPVSLVYTVVGNKPGETSTTQVYLSNAQTMAQFTGFAVAFATILNNFIQGKILDAALVFDVDISGLTGNSAPEIFSDVEEVGAFQFRTTEGVPVDINVPCVWETAVIDQTHTLDQADTRVAALIDAVIDGISVTGGTIEPCDIEEIDLSDLVFAREHFKNSGSRRK